ncbi:MAG TPA: PAS domain-containing protein [Caulobacteraceae bacterium]
MSHSNTARMLGYWEGQRGQGGCPLRSSIDPAAFAEMVTQAFVVGRVGVGAYAFRLAGALLEDLHGYPLSGLGFMSLWAPADRPRLQAAIEAAVSRRRSLIASAHGRSLQGSEARLEILLAPLAGRQGQVDRLLGLYQPTSPLFHLKGQRIERLFLQDIAFADGGESVPSPLRLAAIDGRRVP